MPLWVRAPATANESLRDQVTRTPLDKHTKSDPSLGGGFVSMRGASGGAAQEGTQDTHSPRLGIAVFVHGLRLQSQSLKTGWDCSPSPRPVPQNARDCSPSPLTLSLKIAQTRSRWLKIAQKLLKSLKIAQICSRTSTKRFIEGLNANILLIF